LLIIFAASLIARYAATPPPSYLFSPRSRYHTLPLISLRHINVRRPTFYARLCRPVFYAAARTAYQPRFAARVTQRYALCARY